MSLTDLGLIVDALPAGLRFMVVPVDELLSPEYLSRVAIYCIAAELQKAYSPVADVITSLPDDSQVLSKFPKLRKDFDRDGLLILSNEFLLFDGGLKYCNHFFYYHQFLRRGFSANPNFDFLGTLARYRQKTSDYNKFRIALDHRRLMMFSDWQQTIECDTWYGPKFDQTKLDDPNYTGLTVVGREFPNSLDQYPLIKTEFLWKTNAGKNIKTLEIEELSCPKKPHDKWHVNRYAHVERDMENKTIQHFDGAVKIYNRNEYSDRISTSMPNNSRPSHYIKLFRVDGSINFENWISMLSMFFKGNEMVIEHFDPDLFLAKIHPQRKLIGEALLKIT